MAAVTATLTADVGGYIAAMNRASAVTQSFAGKATQAGERAAASTKRFATGAASYVSKNKSQIDSMSNGIGLFGAAVGAGVAIAARKFADFDQAMSAVAASGEDARNNMTQLRQAAVDAGASTAFSATQAAAGIENLAKAGVSAKDTLGGGLKGALDLAAAGQVDVAFAAETAATAMTQFGLAGSDVPHIADLLAAAAGKAQGEVSDFAGALNQSGLVASQFGLSIEETTGTLAAFASAGLLGSDAGTSFKTMLLRLANPSKEAATTMKDLGVNAYDAQGNFVGIASLAEQLKTSMSGLSAAQRDAALSTIFGSDAIRAANVLFQQGGAGIRNWTSQVNDAGFAAETAKTKLNNLKGDLEGLSGAFETALIGLGEGANGPLRGLVQEATDAVNAFNDLGSGSKQALLVTGASLAGIALGAAAIGKIAIFALEARTALVALGVTASGVRGKLAALNGAGLLATAGFIAVQAASAALQDQLDKNSAGVDGYTKSLSDLGPVGSQLNSQFAQFGSSFALMGQGITDTQSAFDALADTQNVVSQGFRKVGDALGMASTAGILADEFDKIDQALTQMDPDKAADAFTRLSDQARAAGLSTEQINATFDDYKKKQLEQADAAAAAFRAGERAAAGNDAAAGGMQRAGAAAQASAEDIQKATDAMYAQANAALAMSGNAIAVEAAMDAAREAAKKNGETLDINTAKGRANQQALDSLASATLTATQAMVENGESAKSIVSTNERAKASWISTAVAMGKNRDEATELANELFKIPAEVKSQVVVAGAKVSKQEAADLNKALKDIPPEKRAEIVTIAETKGAKAAKQAMEEVKDKDVIARATAVGEKDVKGIDSAMKALKDRRVEAKARGDKTQVVALDRAIKALKGKEVRAKANAQGEAGVRSLKSSVESLRSREITVTVSRKVVGSGKVPIATGGLVTEAGVLYRSNGGPVWGAGTATSDSIPAMLSNGEYVQKAAATSYYGVDFMQALNNLRIPRESLPAFAAGGLVGSYATGGLVDQAYVMRLIAQLITPLTAIRTAAASVAAARPVKAREDREAAAAKRAYERAVAADKKADAAAKRGGTTKAERRRASATEKAKDKAEAEYNKQLDQAKDASSKLTDATRALADANNAAADSARSMSDQFADAFRSASTDAKDWLDTMTGGAADLGAFTKQITQLRGMGLSESLIQQLIGQEQQNSGAGAEAAASILAGGKGLVAQLNAANKSLERAADALGYLGTTAPQRKALGGPIIGAGTGTSDSIPIMASNGEWVVPAHAVPANRAYLESITYGRSVVSHRYAAPGHYRYGGPVTSGVSGGALERALAGMTVYVQNPWTGEYHAARMRVEARGVVVEEQRKAEVKY